MALRKVGVIFTAQGHAQYVSELKQVNQEMRTMSTQAKLAVAQLGNNASISDTYSTKMKSMSSQIDVAQNRTKMLSDQQKILSAEQTKIPKLVEEANKKYKESNTITKDLKKSYTDLAKSKGEDAEETLAAEKAYKSSLRETNKLKKEMKELELVYADNGKELAKLPNEIAKAELATAKLTNAQAKLHEEYRNSGGRLADTAKSWSDFGDQAEMVSDKLNTAGNYMTTRFTAPIVAGFGAAIKTGLTFDQQMRQTAAIAGMTTDDLTVVGGAYEQLRNQAIQLGADSIFGATDVATAQEMMASAGFEVVDIMSAIPGVIDLAAISGKNMGLASEAVAVAMNQFGLEASQATHVADVFARAAADTNAETSDMAHALQYAGTVAGAVGWNFEQTAAAIGIMSNAGVKGSQAGTTLRGVVSRLAKPSKQASKAMEEIGFSAYDAEGKMKQLSQIIPDLRSSFEGMTNEQKENAIVTIFGQEALSGMLALVNSAPGEFDNLTSSLVNSEGAAKSMAEVINSGANGAIEELMGSLETLSISIFDNVAPSLIEVVDSVTKGVESFGQLDVEAQKLIIKSALIVAAIGPVLKTFASLAKGVDLGSHGISKMIQLYGKLTTDKAAKELVNYGLGADFAFTKTSLLGKGLAALTSPVGLTVVAVGSLYTAYKLFGEEAHETYKAMKDFPDITGITGKQADSLNKVTGSFEELDVAFKTLGTSSVGHASTVVGAVDNIVSEISEINSGKLDELNDSLKNLPPDVQAAIQQALSDSVGLAEGQITRAQEIAAEISAIYEVAKREQRDLHDFELQRVMGLEAELQGIYSRVLGNSFEQQQQIYTNLTQGLADMTEKQLEERQFTILKYANQEAETLRQAKEGLESAWQEGLITPDEFTSGLDILEKSYSDNLRKLNISAVQTARERFDRLNEGFETSFDDLVKFVSDATGLGFNEIVTALQSEVPNFDASIKNMIGVVDNGADGLQEAANKWDKAISDFAQSKGLTPSDLGTEHLNEFIEQSKAAGLTWEELNLLSKDANVDDNIKDFLNKTAEAQGGWDSLILNELNATVNVLGMDQLEEMVGLFGGDFDSLEDSQKEALVSTTGYAELSDLLYEYGIWKRESPAEPKQIALETDQAMAAYKELFISQGLWNDSEFLSHIAYIDTNAPDFEEKLATAISEWTGIPVEEVKAMMVETNADDATASIEGTGTALSALGGRSATVTVNAIDNASWVFGAVGRGLDALNGRVVTTYIDAVSRGTRGFATGGHIDAYAAGGNIKWGGMFAAGGNVPKGYSGIVGEDGAELFTVTDRGVTITPLSPGEKMRGIEGAIDGAVAKQLNGKGSSGDTYETHIHITGPVIREDNDIKKLTNQITQAVNKQIGQQAKNKLKGRAT